MRMHAYIHSAFQIRMRDPAATAVPGWCHRSLHVLADTVDLSCYRVIMGKLLQIDTKMPDISVRSCI